MCVCQRVGVATVGIVTLMIKREVKKKKREDVAEAVVAERNL